eukprot:1810933-Pleurochrysis_carterae.AAC.1
MKTTASASSSLTNSSSWCVALLLDAAAFVQLLSSSLFFVLICIVRDPTQSFSCLPASVFSFASSSHHIPVSIDRTHTYEYTHKFTTVTLQRLPSHLDRGILFYACGAVRMRRCLCLHLCLCICLLVSVRVQLARLYRVRDWPQDRESGVETLEKGLDAWFAEFVLPSATAAMKRRKKAKA